MKKHELIQAFYRKLPMYDLSSHEHKFLGEKTKDKITTIYGESYYNPPLPTNVIKNDYCEYDLNKNCYRGKKIE